jgi:hypothetical protein
LAKKEELKKLFGDFYIGYNVNDLIYEYKKDSNSKPLPKIDKTDILPELKERYDKSKVMSELKKQFDEDENQNIIRDENMAIEINDGRINKIKPFKENTETTDTSEDNETTDTTDTKSKGFELLSGKIDRLEGIIKDYLRKPEQKKHDIIYKLQHFYDM